MQQDNFGERIIIICPNKNCQQKLRIPKTSKPIKVYCPKCGTPFAFSSQKAIKRRIILCINKIKKHPILFGMLLTLWFLLEGTMYRLGTITLKGSLYVTAICIGLWFLGAWIIENFKEKGTKWYFQKWFVLLMLIFIPPFGITLLWAGSKFRKATKIAFTVFFGLWFIGSALTRTPGRFYFSPKDEIASLIRAPKESIFIRSASDLVRISLQDEILNNRILLTNVNLTIPQIVQKWGDSVVLVKSIDKDGQEIGLGSGFIVTKEGGIITNYHVVESAYDVSVDFSNRKSYANVSFVVGDASLDIAVLNIDLKGEQFSPLILGDSDYLQVGEKVVAIGNPYGWRNSLSDGLISGIREIDGLSLLQITTPISPGSSGGALFNMKGEVIGITTIASLWGAQNLNFAIPINSFKSFIKQWKIDKKNCP